MCNHKLIGTRHFGVAYRNAGAPATFAIALNAGAVPAGQVRHAVLLIKGETVARFPITIVKG